MSAERLPPLSPSFRDLMDGLMDLPAASGREHALALRAKVRLRARRGRSFPHEEVARGPAFSDARTTIHVAFLTLAGPDSILPDWVIDQLSDSAVDGAALRAFLDALNLRFWEILALAHCRRWSPVFIQGRHAHPARALALAATGACEIGMVLGRGASASLARRSWGAGRAAARFGDIDEFLAEAMGVPVHVRSGNPVRLALIASGTTRLGKGAGLGESALGRHAWLHAGRHVEVTLPDSADVEAWLPVRGAGDASAVAGHSWRRLLAALNAAHGTHLPPSSIALRAHGRAASAALGAAICRLGWGASLSSREPCCQRFSVSSRAIHSVQAAPQA